MFITVVLEYIRTSDLIKYEIYDTENEESKCSFQLLINYITTS